MAGFFDDPMMSMYGTTGQPGFMSNPGIGPFATNLGLALIAAGSGGGAPRSRFGEAAPFLSQAINAPMQMRQQEMMQKLYGAQVGKLEADAARQKAMDEGRINLRNQLAAPSMMPMSDMEASPQPSLMSGVPQANRQMAVSLLDSGVDPDKLMPALMPKPMDPKDRYMTVPGVGLVDISQSSPQTVMAAQGEGAKPLTDAGKAQADYKAGLIDKPTYDAIVQSTGFNARTQVGDIERKWRNELQAPMNSAADLAQQTNVIESALKRGDGTGDIAAITSFNKLLDPGAVVREADVQLTLQAQGLADRLSVWMDNKKEGDILPPALREKMLSLSNEIKQSSSDLLRDRIMSRKDAIEREGGQFDAVVPKALVSRFGWDKKSAQPSDGLTDAERKELEGLREKYGNQQASLR
jgi:hypothetical protein